MAIYQTDLECKMELALDEQDIELLTQRLASEINRDYKHKHPLILGLLTGALYFTADVCRSLPLLSYRLAFTTVKSYEDETSTGVVDVENFPIVRGKDVILLDEIVDSGTTISHLTALASSYGAASVQTCTLINNLYRRKYPLEICYSGITITDNSFFVGYGMDRNDWGRNFKDVYWICQKGDTVIDKFFMWWLEDHYILSTLLTPFITMIWCIFKGEALWRGLAAAFVWVFFTSNASK